jgi:hypothetical protein
LDKATRQRSQITLAKKDARRQNCEIDEADAWRYPPKGHELGDQHRPPSIMPSLKSSSVFSPQEEQS